MSEAGQVNANTLFEIDLPSIMYGFSPKHW